MYFLEKTLGSWTNEGKCDADGNDVTCGPGTQIQTRTCIDGATEKCTAGDTKQSVSCVDAGNALPDCPKVIGVWKNSGACVPTGGGDCGPGTQLQTRTCKDGTADKCTKADTEKKISCADAKTALPSCPKVLGKWINEGSCRGIGADPSCGKGNQDQKRTCEDGTLEKCTQQDKTQTISCSDAGTALPDCSSKL